MLYNSVEFVTVNSVEFVTVNTVEFNTIVHHVCTIVFNVLCVKEIIAFSKL